MKNLVVVLSIGLGVCATGCGRKFAPVSTTTVKTTQTDTTTASKSVTIDSSRYIEKYIQKILHGSTAASTTNIPQLDSLVRALRAMPHGKDTVYLTDPKKDVALKAYMNNLGQLVLACQTRDKVYFEKQTTYMRTIAQLRDSLTHITAKQTEQTTQVVTEKKGFWQSLRSLLNDGLVVLILAVILFALIGMGAVWVRVKLNDLYNQIKPKL